MPFSLEMQVAILVVITLAYALFDLLNSRNVPDIFAYATVILGVACAIAFNYSVLLLDFAIAVAVGALGYAMYVSGFLGGGDVAEFVFISLVLPLQQAPLAISSYQFFIPFIISVLMAAGFAALIYVPIYYLGVRGTGTRWAKPTGRNAVVSLLMLASYAILIAALKLVLGIGLLGAVIMAVLAIASAATVLFGRQIQKGMVEMIYPSRLESGDMIAVNMMSSRDIGYFKRRTNFGRLATEKLISDIRNVRRRIPVYRDSVPFALFLFIGVLVSLVFGNLMLLIIGV